MAKQISASDAKNNFGGLLDDVAALGCVEILKHGRLVAVVMSPQALAAFEGRRPAPAGRWGERHMIAPESAAAARIVRPSKGFDDE